MSAEIGKALEERSDAAPRYVVMVRLPREIEVRIEDAFLAQAGLSRPGMGYHITLLGPFLLAPGIGPEQLGGIAAVCKRHSPFEVHIAGWDAFVGPNENVPYLRVLTVEPLQRLHADLLAATERLIRYQDERVRAWNVNHYQPHVTLGLGLTDRELAHLRAAARREIEASFTVRSMCLAEQVRYHPWQYLIEYPLGDTAA